MDQLAAEVAKKTGLPVDQVTPAVKATVDTLKGWLPPQLAGQLDAALANPQLIPIADQAIDMVEGFLHSKGLDLFPTPSDAAPAPSVEPKK